MNRKLLLYLCLATLTQCSKCKNDPAPADPAAALPPATQTGANTFGCLLNGQAWTPAGDPFAGPIFSSGYSNQNLFLVASRAIIANGINVTQRIQIEVGSTNQPGVYVLRSAASRRAELSDRERNCLFITDKTHPATVEITRLDLVNRVVAGRFAFTLDTPGCSPVVVTDGRFDSRF